MKKTSLFALAAVTALSLGATACSTAPAVAGFTSAPPAPQHVVTQTLTTTASAEPAADSAGQDAGEKPAVAPADVSTVTVQAPAAAPAAALAPAPAPAPVPGPSASASYSAYANTGSTSAPFAQSVLDAWLSAGKPEGRPFFAYSPVTGQNYRMTCSRWNSVEWGCYGGKNAGVTITAG